MEIIRYECPKRCHRYDKSFEEIIEAGNKHREKVFALRDISENQKVKISSLREEKNLLLDKVDKFELDAKQDSDLILRMTQETRSLKRELRDMRMILIEKEEMLSEKTQQVDKNEHSETKVKDLEDELILKNIEISNLENLLNEKQSVEKHWQSELNTVMKGEEDLESKVKSLEGDLKSMKEKESSDKTKREELYHEMDVLTEARQSEVEMLKGKIKSMKQQCLSQCWYGIKCKRLFCRFDHSNVFKKINKGLKKQENNMHADQNVPAEYLCDQCGKVFKNCEENKKHIQSCHEETFKCSKCELIFQARSDLKRHVAKNHDENDIECEQCGKFFVSKRELNDHRRIHQTVDSGIESINNMLKGLLEKDGKRSIDIANDECQNEENLNPTLKCVNCNEIFLTESSLKKHRKRSHRTQRIKSRTEPSLPKVHPKRKLECGMCVIDFENIDEMNAHMDDIHEGRWKYGDPDVVFEGEDYEESESDYSVSEYSDDNDSDESSESESGED